MFAGAVSMHVQRLQSARQLCELVLALEQSLTAPMQAVALALQRSQGTSSCKQCQQQHRTAFVSRLSTSGECCLHRFQLCKHQAVDTASSCPNWRAAQRQSICRLAAQQACNHQQLAQQQKLPVNICMNSASVLANSCMATSVDMLSSTGSRKADLRVAGAA